MFVDRVYVPGELAPDGTDRGRWPFTVPAVAQLLEQELGFTRPVTFLVGDNGSGKSTLVQAIAESFKLDAYGGRLARVHSRPDPTKTPLGEILRADTTRAGARMLAGPRRNKKGFFLRAETAFDMTENLGGVPGYWGEDTSAMSHGEGFLTMFQAMFDSPGFYVMDEPEAALSFASCLRLVGLMHQLGESGAQVICATHSPILASTPGAEIIEIGSDGFKRATWEDLELVDHWRRYMSNPRAYLRHIVP